MPIANRIAPQTNGRVDAAASHEGLEGVGLTKIYGGRAVVDDVHVHVNRGEVVGLLGPNGAGKTTTFYMLLALLEPLQLNEEERQARLQTLLDELGIARLKKSKAGVLSGGERRKVEITRALVLDPLFLCLDEPFAGIDPITVVEIQRIIAYLKERGIGVLMSDHNVSATLSIIDRAYVVSAGKILFQGNPDESVASDAVRQVFLGERFKLPT